MKKRIICFILMALMIISSMPISVFADEVAKVIEENSTPIVRLESMYVYDKEKNDEEFRALPSNDGTFYIDISLNRTPDTDEDILVFYRTVDDSAVAQWGDYEEVGAYEDAYVILSKANKYKARVIIKSQILDWGAINSGNSSHDSERLATRRFLFEIRYVEGNAVVKEGDKQNRNKFYCYLRAENYFYTTDSGRSFDGTYGYNADCYGFAPWGVMEPINTQYLYGDSSVSSELNFKFDEGFKTLVRTGKYKLGISILGKCREEWYQSDGPATLDLYYTYQGKKKKAISLVVEGEFDDSTFFGWEHAYDAAFDNTYDEFGILEDNQDAFGLNVDLEDFIDDNFYSFTVYDNDEKIAYQVTKKDSRDVDRLKNALRQTVLDGTCMQASREYKPEVGGFNYCFWNTKDLYYLEMPSNFVYADSYSWTFTSDTADNEQSEARRLEDVYIIYRLLEKDELAFAKDANGYQMITTNVDQMRMGDPLRVIIRFNQFTTLNPYGSDTLKAMINGKYEVTLKPVQMGYNAWDTFVFEGELPAELNGVAITSIRDFKYSEAHNFTTMYKFKAYVTHQSPVDMTIDDMYMKAKDLRTPVATINPKASDSWAQSRSINVYVNTKESAASRFNDYVTVYYQWSDSKELPKTYDSKISFYYSRDGEMVKTIIGTGNGKMYLHMKAISGYGHSSISDAVMGTYNPDDPMAVYTPFGPFSFDNSVPEFSVDNMVISGDLKNRVLSFELPNDEGVGIQTMALYYIPKQSETGDGVLLKKFTVDNFSGEPLKAEYTISHKDVGACVDDNGNTVLTREEIDFYWIITDKLGNTSSEPIKFRLAFDTIDYLDSSITDSGPENCTENAIYKTFQSTTEMIDDHTYMYNYRLNLNKPYYMDFGVTPIRYGFRFAINHASFGESDNGVYDVIVYFKGEKITDYNFYYDSNKGYYVLWLYGEDVSGRYDIQLTRSEGGSVQISRTYSIYATNGYNDETAVKSIVQRGTLLNSTVYQLSTTYPYFYYKDIDGNRQQEYYNGIKHPASFSSYEKAKEYVYYKELEDIYLIQLTDATASALISGTAGYLIAKGETTTPMAGQYWIRYKSAAWTPTSGDNAWVYYYHGPSDTLNEGSFKLPLQDALNAVSKRITDYGGYVALTDTSLFLGTVTGEKMLDKYGMPYLLEEQLHVENEISTQTKCGNKWSLQVYYTADKNIYKSSVFVGTEGSEAYTEYPIIGNFELPEDSRFQYMNFDDYNSNGTWKALNLSKGEKFIDVLKGSGVYYIREMSSDGVSVYAIYVDKAAPEVSFVKKDENGSIVDVPADGVEITDIRTNNLIIEGFALSEYDRLSYVAVYRVSNLSLVGVYTAQDLDEAPLKLDDGNYYIVVSDRSGNHYTITAKISSSMLDCQIKEYPDKFIKLTCSRRSDQILRYEVYLNGELLTSIYSPDQNFEKAGVYTIYVQDIYGNEFSEEVVFSRSYPVVSWKYLGEDGKYRAYNPENPISGEGFVMTRMADNSYRISTSVKTRFSFTGNYTYEFVGEKPEYSESSGAETVVTIAEGQSFTLKVYYKNHKDCYVLYSGVVDVTPPTINVSTETDVVANGEQSLFEQWITSGNVGDEIALRELYYVLKEKGKITVANGGVVSSDIIRVNTFDANDLSWVQVYLDGTLINQQNAESGFSQIIVSRWGSYKIVAKDTLGNTSEFSFINGMHDGVAYYVDGVEKELELHSYLNFEEIGGRHVYTKVDYGNKVFRLDVKEDGNIFLSVGISNGNTQILGFRVSDGKIYRLVYKIVLDKDGNPEIDLVDGGLVLDSKALDFKLNTDYILNENGSHPIYASIDANGIVSFKSYAPNDSTRVAAISARVELYGRNTVFISSEISKKTSKVFFEDENGNSILGSQTSNDIRANRGFVIDKSFFEPEHVTSVKLYYSKLNDLDVNALDGKTSIYLDDKLYSEEGFYLLVVTNSFGNQSVYRISISRSFGITSSVTFSDGQKVYYSKDYSNKLYSNSEIVLDILNEDVRYEVLRNGVNYSGVQEKNDSGIRYLVFTQEGSYNVKLTDSFGNVIVRELEINKSTYTVDDKLLTGYNEKALKRNEGYTNQKLSVDKSVFDSSGIYYLAVKYGDNITVLVDYFSESVVNVNAQDFVDIIGSNGDGVYTVICRNRYGAIVTKDVHYRGTPTLKLERTTRSKSEPEIYDLNYAISLGFWSNNTLVFSTEASMYYFTVNGNATECPRTLAFDNAGDFGSTEYVITYVDEYGFEYSFKAYLVRKNVSIELSKDIEVVDVEGVLNTKNNISVTFGENTYATYTLNNGESFIYHSGDVLKKDGTYRFTVTDYAGNVSTLVVKKDTMVEFAFFESNTSTEIQSGAVVNSSKVSLNILNKDSAYIEKVLKDGVLQKDYNTTKFYEDGKWEVILSDKLGNKAYFCFYIVTKMQNGFSYTTPYEYNIVEMWFDSGDGIKVSYMNFVNHTDFTSSFRFNENGKYTVVMSSNVTGKTTTFEFTVNTVAPDVSLVGCDVGETTIKDVSITGCKVGDNIKIYRATDTGEELVSEVAVTSTAIKMPTITEGGKYRVVVESEAGVSTELTFVRKHVMNTAGSVFIIIIIALAVVGLFVGLVYRNKSKTDN